LSIQATNTPLFIQIHPDSAPSAGIWDVNFRGLNLRSPGAVCVTGCAERNVKRFAMSEVSLCLEPPVESLVDEVPDPLGKLSELPCLKIPHAIYLRHVHDAQLRNVRVRKMDGGDKRTPLKLQQTADVLVEELVERS